MDLSDDQYLLTSHTEREPIVFAQPSPNEPGQGPSFNYQLRGKTWDRGSYKQLQGMHQQILTMEGSTSTIQFSQQIRKNK